MRCPRCENMDMKNINREGVEINYCPNCRGTYLDRSELDKIINMDEDSSSKRSKDKETERPDYPKIRKRSRLNETQMFEHFDRPRVMLGKLFDYDDDRRTL